jgi:hypothetical protein
MPIKRIVQDDFRDFRRNRFIDAQSSKKVTLAPSLLLTNESGVSGDVPEHLSADDWARVEFDVPSAKVAGAELVYYVKGINATPDKPLRIVVNGHGMNHRQQTKNMMNGGWDRARIPARYLKDGLNTVDIGKSGGLHIDPGAGGRSSRSFDGGATWHRNALGAHGQIQGEYLVRLRLKGFAPEGQLLSPACDLAHPEGAGIAPQVEIRRLRLSSAASVPRGTKIRFEMRSGSTPTFEPRSWTSWQEGTTLESPGRFAQWRATLSSKSADVSPELTSTTLSIDCSETRGSLKGVELLACDHPEIVYSSYDFDYLAPHYKVTRLVKQYRLHDVVAAGKTDLEKFALLRDWVHSQWLGWQAVLYPFCPSWDPLEILETTKGNWGFGMCTHYGAVFAGCASALGYVARVLVVDHHCLAEIWSDELQKWILEDPGPGREHDARYESRGTPVNALEFHRMHRAGTAHHLTINKLPQNTKTKMTKSWGRLFCRFGIPLRNNHLVKAEPAELHHGYSQYHWDGYLWWSVGIDPPYSEYSLQTSRPADFNWSVNQTRLYPRAAAKRGVLQVDVETATPNFSHFETRIDGGEWERSEAPISWSLHDGDNELEVRGVNAFDKVGRVARLKVAYDG